MAIKGVFGDHARKLAVSSTKSMTGHMLGAAGGVEAVVTRRWPLHHGHPAADDQLRDARSGVRPRLRAEPARKQGVDVALSNTFGFGGTNATLAFRKYRA